MGNVLSVLFFNVCKNIKSNHHLVFQAIFPGRETLHLWSINYAFILDIIEILDNIYIRLFLVNCKSVLLSAFVKYMLYSHCTQNCMFLYLLEGKTPYCGTKNLSNFSYISVFILSKNIAQLVLEKP